MCKLDHGFSRGSKNFRGFANLQNNILLIRWDAFKSKDKLLDRDNRDDHQEDRQVLEGEARNEKANERL